MKFIGKLLKTVVLTALALFVSTFIIYMFNLENKLIYNCLLYTSPSPRDA